MWNLGFLFDGKAFNLHMFDCIIITSLYIMRNVSFRLSLAELLMRQVLVLQL